jgi:citrate synthase
MNVMSTNLQRTRRNTCAAAGAHNTIVTSRAGKDLVSCLVSGLLTIGPRFGGAIDDAARNFKSACDQVGTTQHQPLAIMCSIHPAL